MLGRAAPCVVLIVFGALVLVGGVSGAGDAVAPHFSLGAATLGAASPVAGASPAATPAAVRRIEIRGYDFVPAGVEVAVGTTVRWVNEDGRPHTVTAENGAFDSGAMHRGSVFAYTFTETGAYRYVCDYHLNMSGVVLVTSRVSGVGSAE